MTDHLVQKPISPQGHLVQQSISPQAVHLMCHDCSWYAEVGFAPIMSMDQYQSITESVRRLRWAHEAPDVPVSDTEVIDRGVWARVRAAIRGVS